jgi:SAM-dependent methyltransferase
MSVRDLSQALAAIGRSLDEFDRVLDWGCGCGRILRHLLPPTGPKHLSACDIDAEAIAWIAGNLPAVEASVTGGLPPLPYGDTSFDLIFNHSVMSHLDAAYQDAWLRELKRVLRPGGIATLSVHGAHAFQGFLNKLPQGPDRAARAAELRSRGIVFLTSKSGLLSLFPEFYRTSFNDPAYIFDHWARVLNIRCYIPQGALNQQDLVVLQRPAEDGALSWEYQTYDIPNQVLDHGRTGADVAGDLSPRQKRRRGWRLLREGLGLRRAK